MKQAAKLALLTVAILWLPWIVWFAFDKYVLGHEDPKFGRDGGFLLGVYLTGVPALVSGSAVLVIHVVRGFLSRPIVLGLQGCDPVRPSAETESTEPAPP